jgi:hypothetical protein
MSLHFIVRRSRTHLPSLHVPRSLITRVPLLLSKYAKALYLFTYTDLKTTIIPTVCPRLYPNPPRIDIDLSIDHFCLFLCLRYDRRPYAVGSVLDVVAPSSVLYLESEPGPRGRSTE